MRFKKSDENAISVYLLGPSATNASILVVDDEELLLDLVREILEEAGYQVTALASSVSAFHLFFSAPQNSTSS